MADETVTTENPSGEKSGLQKLFAQIIKFGIVGFICFFIDLGVYTFVANVLEWHYLVAGVLGFVISVTVNYLLSMKYVFKSRDDISKTREFIVFVVLSVIGLGLNELILYFCVDLAYLRWNWFWSQEWIPAKVMNVLAKVGATGIVMVYNFVTRKIFLEQKEE